MREIVIVVVVVAAAAADAVMSPVMPLLVPSNCITPLLVTDREKARRKRQQ